MTEIHIPDDVLYAAIAEFNVEHVNSYAKFRAAITAALAAWPGMHSVDHRMTDTNEVVAFDLILPIIRTEAST